MANFEKLKAQKVINSATFPNTTAESDNILIKSGGNLALTDVIDGGAGIDTVFVGGGLTTAQTFNFGANVTNIEVITIANPEGPLNNVGHRVNASAVTTALTINGNGGNNLISAGTANDTVNAGAGNDTVNGNGGNDSIVAGDGNDSVTGGVGADTLLGGAGNDNLDGGDGADLIDGGAGNDTINGGAGTDTLFGGAGNDLFMVTRASDVTLAEGISGNGTSEIDMDGGEGTDQLRFASATAGETLVLSDNVFVESVVIGTGVAAAAVTTAKTALNVNASFVNTALSITGNAGVNTITGTAFDDTITGGAGADVLNGGNGEDTYIYTVNTDFATGERIADTGTNSGDYDTVQINGSGVLTLTAAVTGIEQVVIGNGVTNLAGGVNASALAFNQNTSFIESYDIFDNEVYGGGGIDIIGNTAANNITGTAFGDYIEADAGNDVINAGAGNDTIYGEAGTDTLNGGAGNDVMYGDSADSINGGTDAPLTIEQIEDGVQPENDVLYVSGIYKQASNTRLAGIETIEILPTYQFKDKELLRDGGPLGGSVTLTGQTEAFTVIGSFYGDTIIGGSG